MTILEQVNNDFAELFKETEPVAQMAELSKQMLSKGMLMRGKPFPTFLKPYFVAVQDRSYFDYSTKMIISSLNKVTEAYFSKGLFKEYIEFKGRLGELSQVKPVFPGYQIIARLDVFFMPEKRELKYLEFNCADPSGMGWHDQLLEMFEQLPVIKKLKEKYTLTADKLVPHHRKIFLKKYRQFCEFKGLVPEEKPKIAFVCGKESTILSDYLAFVEYYKADGYDAEYADPCEFEYNGKDLTLRGQVVRLVYRDSMQDFIDDKYWADCQNILNAYRDGNLCFINPVSAAAGGFKSVLEILTDDHYSSMFSKEEKKAHNLFVPWTRNLNQRKTNFRDKTIDLFPFVRENKELFVLKPNAGYGGYGVLIGRYNSQQDWDDLLEKIVKENIQYTVQEFVDIPAEQFPVVQDDQFKGFQAKNVNINFWSHDGEFAGCFVRAAEGSIINIHQGGGLVPVYYVDKK